MAMKKRSGRSDGDGSAQRHQPAKKPQEMTAEERREALRAFGESKRANINVEERLASRTVVINRQLPFFLLGMLGTLFAIFLPHSGSVYGFDVLFYSDRAQEMVTTWPERIYVWLALVGGIFLPIGVIVSRSTLVAWVTWVVSGVGWVFGIFAIWMRQSRPPTEPGSGPSFGLIVGFAAIIVVFATISTVVFRRSVLQRVLAEIRREEADRDDEVRAAQQHLRTGLTVQEYREPVDNRRARARERAHQVAENQRKRKQPPADK